MEYICGITFAPFAARGRFATDETKKSLVLMRERTAANFVIFVPMECSKQRSRKKSVIRHLRQCRTMNWRK